MIRTAIVHDYLVNMGGAEKVLEQILALFPEAPIYTSIYAKGMVSPAISSRTINTSFLQNYPGAKKKWQYFLPLMPRAFESFDLDNYDLVISSSHSCAKGIVVKPKTKHICYCHTPMRYVWDLTDAYTKGVPMILRPAFKMMIKRLRVWDRDNSRRIDHFIANSSAVADRIERYYGRESEVIFPPVDTDFFTPASEPSREYYLAVSRFTPYKRLDLAIDACQRSGRRLKIVGAQVGKGIKVAAGKGEIDMLGVVRGEDLRELYRNAKALIMPALEDFGITMAEAQSCGTPVVAFRGGGALDIIVENQTGVFFDRQDDTSLIKALDHLESLDWASAVIRLNAERFSEQAFLDRMQAALSYFMSDINWEPLYGRHL